MLSVENLEVRYGSIRALHGVTLEVRRGELVVVLGANGAGKSTLVRALAGLQATAGGTIRFRGADMGRLPSWRRTEMGIGLAPEGGRVFASLTVEENLRLGAYLRPRAAHDDLDRVFALFPVLAERHGLPAGTLSGGERQMLAIGRALMGRPVLLLADEVSMGLMPIMARRVFAALLELNAGGLTILLTEQNARRALRAAHRAYVLETGRVALAGTADEMAANPEVKRAYLGG